MGFYDAFREGIFEDMLSFWPLQANMSGRERFLAAKRFGIYTGVLAVLVTGSVWGAVYGFSIAFVSTIAWMIDSRLIRNKDVRSNPFNNYGPGVPPGSLRPHKACSSGGARSTLQSVMEPWDLSDAARFTNMPHPDNVQRRDY